jgi:DNA-binding beta-propeller fold protein YncE
MRQTFSKEIRRLAADSHRQSKKRRQRFYRRSLIIEALEARQMLCATMLGEIGTNEVLVAAVKHNSDSLPPGLARRIEWLGEEGSDADAFSSEPGLAAGATSETASGGSLHPLSDLPQLNSNPGAPATLYLDFDGHFQAEWGGHTNITTPIYDIDEDPTTFSDVELELITLAWKKTAEDFAPFNINVTTVEPPQLAAGVPDSVANGVAMRIAIGGDNSWYGSGVSGVALIGSFTSSAPNTAYVFARSISQNFFGSQDSVGDVATHEAGHAFGLSHQSSYDANGNLIDTYNQGVGNWSPVMGSTFKPVTTWYNGTSGSATTLQDDMAVLAGTANGFGYRPDDHGDSMASATPLVFDGLSFSGSGLIGTNNDADFWSFSISTDDFYRLSVDPIAIGANLDAVLELRDAAGSLIASASPALSQAAELLLPLAPGSFFLSVTKTAAYGWLGAYSVSVTAPPAGVSVSASQPLVTREGGPSSTFTIVLDTPPTADVIIPLSSGNTGEATIDVTGLLFTPANWNVPQMVVVTGVEDGVQDGDVSYSVLLGPASSADSGYAGLDPADVTGVNLDNHAAGFVYWVNSADDTVMRSTLHGTDVQTIVDLKALFGGTGANYAPRYVDVDASGGKVYWSDSVANRIQRANLDGSSVETLVPGFTGEGLRGIAVDSAAGKVYWTDFAAQKIQRANLDGTNVEDLVTGGLSAVRDIAVDPAGGKMYWADIVTNNIRRANLDGSQVEVLWTGIAADSPTGVALDLNGEKIYWCEFGRNRVFRSNFDGSQVEELFDLPMFPEEPSFNSLAIDSAAGKIYIADFYNNVVHRANLDGSYIVPVASGLSGLAAVTILRPGVTVTPVAGLFTSESGVAANFQVTLTTPPTAIVTIPVSSGDATEGTVSTTSITFTPANWNVPQTVTVTGVNDTIFDGDVAYSVVLGAATSSDPDYAGINPRDVSLTNLDNEVKFYVVNDATTNLSYKYGADGSARGNTTLATANAAPRGVASTILGDKTWVVDANRNVYVYRSSDGALLGSWAAGSMAGNATPEGIATNGADVWIIDGRSDKVYRYAGAAGRISGSQTAASSFNLASANPKDIVTDGASLWVVDDTAKTDKVFKYSVAGALQGSWTIDAANKAPTGITIDPSNVSHIWIVDSGTDSVYQYSAAASRTSGSQSAALSFALAAGNSNPQGIADPPAPAMALATVATAAETMTYNRDSLFKTAEELPALKYRQTSDRYSGEKRAEASARSASSRGKNAELLLARERVFDAFDKKRNHLPTGRPSQAASQSEQEKSSCGSRAVSHSPTLAEVVDAVFAGAM